MAPFRWADIDHRLVVLKLAELGEEMRGRITADERRIQFENRLNMNSSTVPSAVLRMKQERADEWARSVYEIYCAVWQTQGGVKSAAFVRAVSAQIVLMLGARASSIANQFSLFARRTNFPGSLKVAYLKGIDLQMRQLQGRWQRRLEIEAKECEHTERRLRVSQQTLQSARMDAINRPKEVLAIPQPSTGEGRPGARVSDGELNGRKPGRSPKVDRSFIVCARALWRKAISDSHARVSDAQLRQIASALDTAGHLPPSAHLEGKFGQELKAFNTRNSNSKIGPVMTWSQLVSLGDKDHLRGMRRLLSRCAKKSDEGHLSGN